MSLAKELRQKRHEDVLQCFPFFDCVEEAAKKLATRAFITHEELADEIRMCSNIHNDTPTENFVAVLAELGVRSVVTEKGIEFDWSGNTDDGGRAAQE